MKAIALIAVMLVAHRAKADEPPVQVVFAGAPVPFNGLLVPEGRMAELLKAEVDAEGLAKKLAVEQEFSKNLEAMYDQKLVQATRPLPWFESPRFYFALGATIGVVATSAAIYGGVKLVEAAR